MAEFIYTMKKVRKAHGDKVILDDVTLSFFPGAKIGVVGPNGAGKSSVLRIMAGLDICSRVTRTGFTNKCEVSARAFPSAGFFNRGSCFGLPDPRLGISTDAVTLLTPRCEIDCGIEVAVKAMSLGTGEDSIRQCQFVVACLA